ncbi:MAG: class I SAM-dependent methyltransferase [Chloroflexota bacterium]
MDTDRAAELNRRVWDSFRRQRDVGLVGGRQDVVTPLARGHSYLGEVLRELAGNVRGQRLLDLGCGDGAELLEWARLGAEVVGVDNSSVQLAAARRNADALGVPRDRCRLVLADVLRLPDELLQGAFDIVFSSAVLTWIGDLDRWFAAVVAALKPGGVFLLEGGHPLAAFYRDQQQGASGWDSYFDEGPFVERCDASHRWNPAGEDLATASWMPTLGHVVTAVAQAGLRVSHLVEVPDHADVYGIPGGPGTFVVRAVRS